MYLKQTLLLLSSALIISTLCSAVLVSGLEEPYVIVSSLHYEPLQYPPSAFVVLGLTIINPTNETIILDHIEYTVFVDQVQVPFLPLGKETCDKKLNIVPFEKKIINIEFIVDLSAADKLIVDKVLNGSASWNVIGLAYFNTSAGIFKTPLRGYTSTSMIKIKVVDENWKPLDNANITLTSETALAIGWPNSFSKISNELGIAEFEVPTAKYRLTVKKEGYQPYEEILDLSKPLVGGKVVQLIKIPIPWWQQYWYIITAIVIVCIVIPLILKVRVKTRKA